MGLDVHLYHLPQAKETFQKEDLFEQLSNKFWEDEEFQNLTEEERFQKSNELAKQMGLDSFGQDVENKKLIEQDSVNYPDHLFKVGYFRSSYNDGGINRILDDLGIPGLYDIFLPNEELYWIQPDWERALGVVEESIKQLKKIGNYRISEIHKSASSQIKEKPKFDQILEEFFKEKNLAQDPLGNYRTAKGIFYFEDPLVIRAILPHNNGVFIVSEEDNTWYLQALEIVKETIEFVLKQEDKQNYWLSWSA